MKPYRIPLSALLTLALLLAGALVSAPSAWADLSVKGSIVQVSPASNSVTVDAGKDTVTFYVGSFSWVTKDNIDCKLVNLRPGDKVRATVFLSEIGQLSALKVEAQTHGRKKSFKGTVVEFLPNEKMFIVDPKGNGKKEAVSVSYDEATLFIYGSASAPSTVLKVGDNVTVMASLKADDSSLATRVDISTVKEKQAVLVFGILKAVTEDGTLVVRTWKGGEEEFLATENARKMTRNKRPVAVADLIRGDRIVAVGTRNFAGGIDGRMIEVQSPNVRFTGTITSINESDKTIVLRPFGGGDPVTLLLLPASVMLLNGQDANLSLYKIGDLVTVTSIIHPEGPWGITSLEVVRLGNKGDD